MNTKQKNRQGWKEYILVAGGTILLAAGVYIAVQLFNFLSNPYRTETVLLATMTDSVTLTGVAVFQAEDVEGSGNLGYLVEDGERVKEGTVLAERYTDDNQSLLRERLEQVQRNAELLQKSQNASVSELSVLSVKTREALYNLLDIMDSEEFDGMSEAEDEYLLAQNRLQICTGQSSGYTDMISRLEAEQEELTEQLSALDTVVANTNGYFVSSESVPSICPTLEEADAMTPTELETALQQQNFAASSGSLAGRIVNGFNWYFYAVCDTDTAERLQEVSSVKISVPGKANEPLKATLQDVIQEDDSDTVKVVFCCQSINADVLRLGVENARIDLHSYEGLRISKSALHIVEGNYGVYVKWGIIAKFLRIPETPLCEDENYILIKNVNGTAEDNQLKLYDEVIVQGKNLGNDKLL